MIDTDMANARQRVVERYRNGSRFDRGFIAGKLRRDPIYADLFAAAGNGFGDILDVGCGRGQLGLLLLEAGIATQVVGFDWNANHIAQAKAAARAMPIRLERRDLSVDPTLPQADTVFLIDILYQLDTTAQHALLAAAIRSARTRLVIRTPDSSQGLRYRFMRLLENLGQGRWPHAGAWVNPQPVAVLQQMLVAAGFHTTVTPCWRGTPFANVLVIGSRQAGR